jgi:hypothetical protein
MRRFPNLQFSMESPLRSKHPVRPLVTARRAAVRALAGLVFSGGAAAEVTLLNVSYDPTREFYQEFNAAFARHWAEEHAGERFEIRVLQPASPATFLHLRGHYEHPKGGTTRLEALAPDGERRQLALRHPGSFEWLLPLSDVRPDARLVYRITADRSFVPADCIPGSTDQRCLVWKLESLELRHT